MGKGGERALLTRVERKTLYTVILRLTGKQSALLAKAVVEGMETLKAKILTITLDNELGLPGMRPLHKGSALISILLIPAPPGRGASMKIPMV